MESVKEILNDYGVDSVEEMDLNESYTAESDHYMDLTIEKIGENRLSVAHYKEQRRDLMRDPEIVFEVDGDDWTPVRYVQDPFMDQYDPDGIPEAEEFAQQWDENLRKQGFVPDQ